MQNLTERIKIREKIYEEYIKSEYLLENEMGWLGDIIPYEKVEVFVGTKMITIDYSSDDIEEIELKIVPAVSEHLHKSWTKDISAHQVVYRTNWRLGASDKHTGIGIALIISFWPDNTCRIRQVATGRKIKKIQTVELELPEVTYEIDCGGG